MSGTEDQTHGSNPRTSNMFLEELNELVKMYLSKVEDRHRVIALMGTAFVQTMIAEGVDVDTTLEVVLDELDFQTNVNNPPAEKPLLRLVQNN